MTLYTLQPYSVQLLHLLYNYYTVQLLHLPYNYYTVDSKENLMHLTIGASDVFSVITRRILSPMTWWFSLVRISHSCQILSVDGACLSLATFVVPTPVKTILELFRPAFGVRQRLAMQNR